MAVFMFVTMVEQEKEKEKKKKQLEYKQQLSLERRGFVWRTLELLWHNFVYNSSEITTSPLKQGYPKRRLKSQNDLQNI